MDMISQEKSQFYEKMIDFSKIIHYKIMFKKNTKRIKIRRKKHVN